MSAQDGKSRAVCAPPKPPSLPGKLGRPRSWESRGVGGTLGEMQPDTVAVWALSVAEERSGASLSSFSLGIGLSRKHSSRMCRRPGRELVGHLSPRGPPARPAHLPPGDWPGCAEGSRWQPGRSAEVGRVKSVGRKWGGFSPQLNYTEEISILWASVSCPLRIILIPPFLGRHPPVFEKYFLQGKVLDILL